MTAGRLHGALSSQSAMWAFIAGVGSAALVGWGVVGLPVGAHVSFSIPWPVLALAFVGTELIVIPLQLGVQSVALNLAEVPLIVGLVFCGPAGVVPARVAAAVAVYVGHRRQSAAKAAYNICAHAFETVVALRVYFAALDGASPISRRGWLAAFMATAAAQVSSAVGVVVVRRISSGRRDRRAMRTLVPASALVTLTNCSLSLIAVCVLWVDPLGALLLAGVCGVLGVGYRSFQEQRRRQSVLERMHDFTQAVDAHTEVGAVVSATLHAARETMAATVAELYLHHSTGWRHHRLEGDAMVNAGVPQPEALERVVLAGGKGILVRRSVDPAESALFEMVERGIGDAVSVPIHGADLHGTLTITDRQSQTETFTANDLRALTSMGAHAAVALNAAMLLERLHREVRDKEHQALHDPLTGLPNRSLFASRVDELLGAPDDARLAVMLVDLDGFKEVNDTLGHAVGDVVLRATAARLQGEVASRGTVAHLGGDEFAVIVAAGGPEDARRAALGVKAAIEQPIEEEGLLFEVRASIGVALSPQHGDGAATLLRLADVAMYSAKERRIGVALYEAGQDHYSPRRLTLAGDLRQALAAGGLSLAYQPQADLATGHINAVEALVRWSHERHGMVPPDEFIPMAEQTGLIIPLTDYVLTRALAQQAQWSRRGIDLVMAVNLSPRVVQDGQLPALVEERLAGAGVPADRLTLELTETGLMTDPARVAAILHQLAAMGVRASIDDFGTGFSSLSRLSGLPVGEIKIDKSFVFAVADGGGETVVRSIVDLGHNLGLRVVAEGVEDEATLDRLRQLGCHAVQGYVLSRALSAPLLEEWLGRHPVGGGLPSVIVAMRKPRAEPGRPA